MPKQLLRLVALVLFLMVTFTIVFPLTQMWRPAWMPDHCYPVIIVVGSVGFCLVINLPRFYTRPEVPLLEKVTEEKQAKALGALADWSKWLITIETGLIAFLMLTLKGEVRFTDHVAIFTAALCFVASIMAATALLAAIPPALEEIPITTTLENNKTTADIYSYKFIGSFPLRHLAAIEHTLFIVGIVCLLIAVAYVDLSPRTRSVSSQITDVLEGSRLEAAGVHAGWPAAQSVCLSMDDANDLL